MNDVLSCVSIFVHESPELHRSAEMLIDRVPYDEKTKKEKTNTNQEDVVNIERTKMGKKRECESSSLEVGEEHGGRILKIDWMKQLTIRTIMCNA